MKNFTTIFKPHFVLQVLMKIFESVGIKEETLDTWSDVHNSLKVIKPCP